jgi:hypothetical protein
MNGKETDPWKHGCVRFIIIGTKYPKETTY